MRALAALLSLALCSCLPETGSELGESEATPSPAEQLAAFGKMASTAHGAIEIRGGMPGSDVRFVAQYAPAKQTLIYELTTPEKTERIVVSPEDAILSVSGAADLEVNRDSFMPNGKDWPYGSRMVAPFLDAIDGYAATLHSFHINAATPPADVEGADSLTWFGLTLNRDNAHDLLFLESSKVSELKIGVDPKSGLLKSLHSLPKDGAPTPTEIRAE